MKRHLIILAGAILTLGITTVKTTQAIETKDENVKSVAWYVANIKEARQQNKACYDNPELQATPNCVNSLHALQISFVGGN